jgi:hypothetical protein
VVVNKQSASALPSPSVSESESALGMAAFGPMNYCRPVGIGLATPKMLVTNLDLESVVETSDEWILPFFHEALVSPYL